VKVAFEVFKIGIDLSMRFRAINKLRNDTDRVRINVYKWLVNSFEFHYADFCVFQINQEKAAGETTDLETYENIECF
jgi:hypothetical protein